MLSKRELNILPIAKAEPAIAIANKPIAMNFSSMLRE
jgi:hypothetical protein